VRVIEDFAQPILDRDPYRQALQPETRALLLELRYAIVTADANRIERVSERWDAHLAALPAVQADEARGQARLYAQLTLGLAERDAV